MAHSAEMEGGSRELSDARVGRNNAQSQALRPVRGPTTMQQWTVTAKSENAFSPLPGHDLDIPCRSSATLQFSG